jgi:hemolysin III
MPKAFAASFKSIEVTKLRVNRTVMMMPIADMAIRQRLPTPRELAADGLVHAIGIIAGLVGATMLIMIATTHRSVFEFAALLTYSGGLVAMLCCSAAYNLFRSSPLRELLRRFDHAAIFVMIAGTYTPFTTLRLEGFWAVVLTGWMWFVAALGIALKLLHPQLFDRLSIGFYLTLGWTGLIALDPLLASLRLSTLVLLAVGGVLYTIGVIFHVWERLPFQNAIWHGFVLIAAGVHYVAILDGVVL